jgi:hypothetical protein
MIATQNIVFSSAMSLIFQMAENGNQEQQSAIASDCPTFHRPSTKGTIRAIDKLIPTESTDGDEFRNLRRLFT